MSELMGEAGEKLVDSMAGMSELELREKLSAKTVDALIEIIMGLLRIISMLNMEVNVNVEFNVKTQKAQR